jgi:predicted N-formylglutamate amidohydrolase
LVERIQTHSVLSARDPEPVEAVNMAGRSIILLTCEHAGRLVPERLGDLGVPQAEMDRHIAYDVGAAGLSRLLAVRLDAPLLMQRYSRLVIDCNRPFEAVDCFPEVSDGTPIAANVSLALGERRARYEEIHVPFHQAVKAAIDKRRAAGLPVVLVSVHSFTRHMRSTGAVRQCDLGLLFNREPRFAQALMREAQAEAPEMRIAFNEPYIVDDASDYTIPVHGEAGGVPHVLLEVINDEIADEAGQQTWAGILTPALQRAAKAVVGASTLQE